MIFLKKTISSIVNNLKEMDKSVLSSSELLRVVMETTMKNIGGFR